MSQRLIPLLSLLLLPAFAADVPVITSGKTPVGQAYTLKLTEDLRVGPDDDDEHFLWGGFGGALAVNDDGHMFVVDPANFRIVQVDPQGKFVREIGQRGGGPGEFQALASFQILADGRGAAFEALGPASRFSFFDKEGKYVERMPVSQPGMMVNTAILSPDAKLIFSLIMKANPQKGIFTSTYAMVDGEGEIKTTFQEYDQPIPNPAELGNQDKLVELMAEQFQVFAKGLFTYVTYDDKGNVYTANSAKYEVTHWDSQFSKKRIIKRNYQPVVQTEEDVNAIVDPIYETLHSRLPPNIQSAFTRGALKRAIELADFPPSRVPIFGLNTLKDGSLVVVHKNALSTKKMESDLYNDDGKFIGSFEQVTPGSVGLYTTVFKGDFMYNFEVDEEGDAFLVRYKYDMVRK